MRSARSIPTRRSYVRALHPEAATPPRGRKARVVALGLQVGRRTRGLDVKGARDGRKRSRPSTWAEVWPEHQAGPGPRAVAHRQLPHSANIVGGTTFPGGSYVGYFKFGVDRDPQGFQRRSPLRQPQVRRNARGRCAKPTSDSAAAWHGPGVIGAVHVVLTAEVVPPPPHADRARTEIGTRAPVTRRSRAD